MKTVRFSSDAALATLLLSFVLLCGPISAANAQSRTPEEQAAKQRYQQMDAAYENANPAAQVANQPPTAPVGAQTQESCPLSPEQAKKAATAFSAMNVVLKHPRCTNCHGVFGDLHDNPNTLHPKPGGHIPQDARGGMADQCISCHDRGGSGLPIGDIKNKQWELAPEHLFFTGRTDIQVCRRFKTSLDGTGAGLLKHVTEDRLIMLGFEGKKGQSDKAADPPPIPHRKFLELAAAWITAVYGTSSQQEWTKQFPGEAGSACGCDPSLAKAAQENPDTQVTRVVTALQSLPQCPGMQLGPACFQKFSVSKSGLAASTSLAREPAAGSERTDVRATAWPDQATADRDFKSDVDAFRAKKRSPSSVFESFAIAGRPDSGALEVWLDSNFGGESREAGQAFGVLICGKVVGHLKMFISAGFKGASGQALVEATRTQLKGLLQQIGSALLASGACA